MSKRGQERYVFAAMLAVCVALSLSVATGIARAAGKKQTAARSRYQVTRMPPLPA